MEEEEEEEEVVVGGDEGKSALSPSIVSFGPIL